MEYNFGEIEKKWRSYWKENKTFRAEESSDKPKYYALDMFPYPSGAGLHVGHPLGYIASDIVSRYKRSTGHNVLHPMGFDSFGLPAEQYAIQTGQHPKETTETNIRRYKEQLDNMGFSYDWDREFRTSDPSYFKFTQWIFIQLFKSWYNIETDKAEDVSTLVAKFEANGTDGVNGACDEKTPSFTAQDWNAFSEKEQSDILLDYRLAFISETMVNWCPELGTVLANDEVVNGVSERGGHPVERKTMKQWSLRITAYADRLLRGLDTLEWSDALKEMQRNWIGKSYGCSLNFKVVDQEFDLTVFTTRVDTSFGVTYLSVAPEHEIVSQLTTEENKTAVEEYVAMAKNRSERDRMSDVKTVSGVFTGSYAINPMNGEKVPVWIADYVLAGYGTGVVMAVPSSDERDYKFATHYKLPIINVQEGPKTDITADDFDAKAGTMINSGFLNGLTVQEAIKAAIKHVEDNKLGEAKVNFKMRDAIFSRQRYWGEPIPIYYKDEIPYAFDTEDLPLELPEIDDFKPTPEGDPPLGRAENFVNKDGYPIELNTMPGWAGSSWYFFRYMDANNDLDFASTEALDYWQNVDLYIGGTEHATGHLLYSRFWNKFLFDRGYVKEDEVFRKLVNQGMIQGESAFVYRIEGTQEFISKGFDEIGLTEDDREQLKSTEAYGIHGYQLFKRVSSKSNPDGIVVIDPSKLQAIHADISFVNKSNELSLQDFRYWREDYREIKYILQDRETGKVTYNEVDGQYLVGRETEKMSKSKYNVVNPDDIVKEYGADTLRMYEMFLGPIEQAKPWSTNGIDGVYKFLRKFWRLFYNEDGVFHVVDEPATDEENKILHATIKKVSDDIEKFSLNTSISNFMICVNELTAKKCNKREVLEQLVVLIAPFAPHVAEELFEALGGEGSVCYASWPEFDEKYLKEDAHEYPIMINGKMRTKISFGLDMPQGDIQKEVLANEIVQKWLDGKDPKKLIVVPKKIINVVV